MYKITLHYQSEKIGVYTTEITINNYIKHDNVIKQVMTSYEVNEMFDRWSNKLCRHIDLEKYIRELSMICQSQYTKDGEFNLKLKLIQSHLNDLNEMNKEKIESGEECKRSFNITVEEII